MRIAEAFAKTLELAFGKKIAQQRETEFVKFYIKNCSFYWLILADTVDREIKRLKFPDSDSFQVISEFARKVAKIYHLILPDAIEKHKKAIHQKELREANQEKANLFARSFGVPDYVHIAASSIDTYTITMYMNFKALETLAHYLRLIEGLKK